MSDSCRTSSEDKDLHWFGIVFYGSLLPCGCRHWARAQDELYPPFVEEGLAWEAHECEYAMYPGEALEICITQGPAGVFVGESFARQLYST